MEEMDNMAAYDIYGNMLDFSLKFSVLILLCATGRSWPWKEGDCHLRPCPSPPGLPQDSATVCLRLWSLQYLPSSPNPERGRPGCGITILI